MIERLRKLIFLLDNYKEFRRITNRHHDDINSFEILRPLLENRPYVPFTKYALSPYAITLVINDILLHDRACVVEVGSGVFTLLLARLIEQNQLSIKFYSLESDLVWTEKVRTQLRNEHLEQHVQFIHSPLGTSGWYDKSIIQKSLVGTKIDCLLVDGPKSVYGQERLDAIPFFLDYLDLNSFTIFLDDANRSGERDILQTWSKIIDIKAMLHAGKVGQITRQSPYYIAPGWNSEEMIRQL
ncbi:MAG: class I SAM-dependent methyltransferase [Marinoscillum sp.]